MVMSQLFFLWNGFNFNSFLNFLRRVLPLVEPGYLRSLIPEQAPEQGEQWQSIFQDVERVIMPGV